MVGHAVRAARDDTEVLVAEAHDREIGLEATARGEPRRVDDPSDGHVDLTHRHRLQRVERAPGPDTSKIANADRSKIPARSRIARCSALMIGDHQRLSHSASRPPTRSPYSSSSPRVRLVPLRPLPAGRLEEDRAELLLPLVVRREAHVAVRGPLLERMHDAVRLVEPFGRPRLHVRRRLLLLPEPRRVGGVEVDVRLAVHHPLRERLPDARPLLDPDGRGRPETLHLGQLAEDRHPVGRQREDPVDRVLDADRLVADDRRHQLERLLHLQVEVLLRERELGRRERRLLDRRQVLGVVQDRAVRVRADLEPRPVLALVHVRVHVAHDRELDVPLRVGEPVRRADVDHLVHGRCERDRRAGHARELRAPDAARDDDDLRLDVTGGRPNAASPVPPRRRCRAPRCSRRPRADPTPARARA